MLNPPNVFFFIFSNFFEGRFDFRSTSDLHQLAARRGRSRPWSVVLGQWAWMQGPKFRLDDGWNETTGVVGRMLVEGCWKHQIPYVRHSMWWYILLTTLGFNQFLVWIYSPLGWAVSFIVAHFCISQWTHSYHWVRTSNCSSVWTGRRCLQMRHIPRWSRVQGGIVWDLDVSKNRGAPKSSILMGFSLINHPFWGTIIVGNTHLKMVMDESWNFAP